MAAILHETFLTVWSDGSGRAEQGLQHRTAQNSTALERLSAWKLAILFLQVPHCPRVGLPFLLRPSACLLGLPSPTSHFTLSPVPFVFPRNKCFLYASSPGLSRRPWTFPSFIQFSSLFEVPTSRPSLWEHYISLQRSASLYFLKWNFVIPLRCKSSYRQFLLWVAITVSSWYQRWIRGILALKVLITGWWT